MLVEDNFDSENEDKKIESLGKVSSSNSKIKERINIRDSLSEYDNPLYRRYFVYKNVVYSKVEIQGIVIEKRALGYEEKNNYRYLIYIDDTTGVIQAISWKNKNAALFSKIEKDLVNFY